MSARLSYNAYDKDTTPGPNPSWTSPVQKFANAIDCALTFGRDLLGRIQGALRYNDTSYLPRSCRNNPAAAEKRVARALDWLGALTRTLVGDRFYLPTPPRPKPPQDDPLAARHRAARLARIQAGWRPPPRTEWDRERDELRRMRHAFATQPIGKIARRLCTQLCIRKNSDHYLAGMVDLAETPAQWNARINAAAAHPPFCPPADPTPLALQSPPPRPAYHRRE